MWVIGRSKSVEGNMSRGICRGDYVEENMSR